MQALFAFGLLILLGFLGARLIVRRSSLLSPLTFLFVSGLVYIFLGFALGARGINVLNERVLTSLNPVISLGLGWIGFLFGFQLELKYLRRFPRKYIGLSFVQFLSVLVMVFVGTSVALRWLFPLFTPKISYGLAVAFGLLISLNSPTLLNAASKVIPSKSGLYYLARFLVSVSGFWGIVGLAILTCFGHYPFFESSLIFKGAVFFATAIFLPALLGYVFHVLTKRRTEAQDLLVYLLGLVFFVSGAAFYFNLPPLFMGMVLGITYSNLTRMQEKLYPLLLSTENPLFITFLILIGALWDLRLSTEMGVLVALLIILQLISYCLPLPVMQRILRWEAPLPAVFGLCFLSPGGIGVAFAVSLTLTHPVPEIDGFLSMALLFIILSEILSPWALRISLSRLNKRERK